LREHAAFVVSQTRVEWRDAALIEAGRGDASGKVRGQAWFWLAQTGTTRAESALQAALASEKARNVREQIVFALSQLPAPRSTDALIELIERPGAARDLRERALFWLAQSDDERAYAWLDRRLGASND
jgi:HEAT repeat protein